MNAYQNKIKSATQSAFSSLSRFADKVTEYRQKLQEIAKMEYLTQEGKEQETDKAKAALVQYAASLSSEISLDMSAIRKAALDMESDFTITPELQAAVTLLGAAGDSMDTETVERVWRGFIGNHYALTSLKALLESKGANTRGMEKYIFKAETQCDKLDDLALTFKIQPGTNLNQTVALGKALEEFCELEGVELDNSFVGVLGNENYSQFYTEQLKAAFGV